MGYVALLEGTVYKETAVAVQYTELAVIPRNEFELLLATDLQTSRFFMELIAEKLTQKDELLLGLAYNSLRKKVAEALVLLNGTYKNGIIISRDNLAAIAGTATASLIRTLKEFKDEHIIDIRDGVIFILSENRLKKTIRRAAMQVKI